MMMDLPSLTSSISISAKAPAFAISLRKWLLSLIEISLMRMTTSPLRIPAFCAGVSCMTPVIRLPLVFSNLNACIKS